MKTCLDKIHFQTGGITNDLLLAMGMHFRFQSNYQEIANTLDSRLAVNKSCKITVPNVLELEGQLESGPAPASDLFAYWAQKPTGGGVRYLGNKGGGNCGSVMWRSAEWARRVLSERNPCQYCWEWGHWISECHLKKAQKTSLGNPLRSNPGIHLKKSANCHPALLNITGASNSGYPGRNLENVAAVKHHPGNDNHDLLDSGATDSISNDVKLY
ncbi:uncharacterized protein VP01_187g4 [Puccinia sorghi]|uniref:Uncharacterized protein n=1 Tax=Puccinia sorghi TaxID=27349 RepID=A0A0L6VD09_9BASI|nr:uncharacterized protein VP01_187g4 [Puccinia sorghi]